MKNKNKVYWVWLASICKPSSRTAVNLVRHFDSAEAVFGSSRDDLLGSKILKENDRIFTEISEHDLGRAKDIVDWCGKNGVGILTPDDDLYPSNLFSLRDAPIVLYTVGDMPDFDKYCSVSCVGSRRMSEYGRVNSFRFGYGLASGGAVVVSGLALGVDGMSMASSYAAGGISVGVLGSGIDVVYPKEHLGLFKRVIESGAVITEYEPGSKPQKNYFPQRNRIISGLSQGTLVIEADADSGALITSRYALYQGKDVFAVPGAVGNYLSEGTNELIKEGAFAVTDPVDVIERYEYVYPHSLSVSSARSALSGVDVIRSSERVAMKFGVTTEQDRSNVYSMKAGREFIAGSPIVSAGADYTDDAFDVPFDVGSKPEALPVKEKAAKKEKPKFPLSEPKRIDFELLSEDDMKIYKAMKNDTPMVAEELLTSDNSISDVMASLTMLEIAGAVEAGAGGYFIKNTCDDNAEYEISD